MLCAALLVGIAGPLAVAGDSVRERSHAASPDTHLDSLRDSRLAPVADLATAVEQSDDGQPTTGQINQLGDAAENALTDPQAQTPETAATDLASDPLAVLRQAINNLVQAIASGDAGQVSAAEKAFVTALSDYIEAVQNSSGLPTPTPTPTPTETPTPTPTETMSVS
ncbi:hypothetical protein [Streptomyces sp. NPDC047453]|uniref:hypothetical protein n=1 Tax=Streptomyces sp. NPDC047453 TaxID=3154812 RepID=UPI0034040ED6